MEAVNRGLKFPTMVSAYKAAELSGLSYAYILRGCKSGEIVHIKSNSRFLINLEKLIEKMNSGELDPEA